MHNLASQFNNLVVTAVAGISVGCARGFETLAGWRSKLGACPATKTIGGFDKCAGPASREYTEPLLPRKPRTEDPALEFIHVYRRMRLTACNEMSYQSFFLSAVLEKHTS